MVVSCKWCFVPSHLTGAARSTSARGTCPEHSAGHQKRMSSLLALRCALCVTSLARARRARPRGLGDLALLVKDPEPTRWCR